MTPAIVILSHVVVALFLTALLCLLAGLVLEYLRERRLAGRHPAEITAEQILAFSNITTRPLKGQAAPAPPAWSECRSRFEEIMREHKRLLEILYSSCAPETLDALELALDNHTFAKIQTARKEARQVQEMHF